eukprot:2674526-Prymnesium_polylepis.1
MCSSVGPSGGSEGERAADHSESLRYSRPMSRLSSSGRERLRLSRWSMIKPFRCRSRGVSGGASSMAVSGAA